MQPANSANQVAIVSTVTKSRPRSHEQSIRLLAYQLADEHQTIIYIISSPQAGLEYRPCLPYCIFADEANLWEKQNGEKVDPRQVI